MPIPLIVAAAIAGGVAAAAAATAAAVGKAVADGQADEAKKIYDKAVEDYGDDILPELNKKLSKSLPESAFKSIAQSEGRQGMRETYSDLRDVYKKEGMTDADQAAMNLARKETSGRASQQYAQLQQQLASRGQANNPILMAALQADIGASELDALSTANMQSQVAARQRATQALGQAGGMAQAMGQQDVAAADAMDRINMFNFDKQQQLRQQDFQNMMAVREAKNAARYKNADYYTKQADRTERMFKQFGDAAMSAGEAVGGAATKK